MGLNLPKAVTSLVTSDPAVTRALASVKTAVDPVLSLVGSCFVLGADGVLRVVRSVVLKSLQADQLQANSTQGGVGTFTQLNASGPNRINGATTALGTLVVQTLPDGTQGALLVQGNLTVGGTLTSATGFKSYYDMGWAWASGATAGTRYRTAHTVQNQEANNTFKMPALFQPQVSGSILGIQTWTQGAAGGNINVQLFKNTVVSTGTPAIDVTAGSAAANVGNTVTYAKGVVAVGPRDYFLTTVTFSVAGNQAAQVRLYYELSA